MPVRIIKAGRPPGEVKLTFKCTNCQCEFEVPAKECQFHGDQRDGDYYTHYCPQTGCGKIVYTTRPSQWQR